MEKKTRKSGGYKRILTDYLTFNRQEQRGIMVLLTILLGLVLANSVIPSETFQKPVDFRNFEREVSEFEQAWTKGELDDSLERMKMRSRFSTRSDKWHNDTMTKPRYPEKPILVIELNAADTFDLQRLRGIGPAFARRIVNYRQRLGGFVEKRQLAEVFGMDSARYRMVEPNIRVNADSVITIDLNNITFKELLRHPYFPFGITKNIMLYRQKNKRFKSMEELLLIPGISDSLYLRMKVYLRLD